MDVARRISTDATARLANAPGQHAPVHQIPRLPRGTSPMISLPSSPRPQSAPSTRDFISLDHVRTGVRATNDYVDPPLPLRPAKNRHNNNVHSDLSSGDSFSGPGRPIKTQPSYLKKSPTVDPIMCSRCNHCKCDKCVQPRALPERWLCNKNVLCSADNVVEWASCLCAPKFLYFHCTRCSKDSDPDNEVRETLDMCACFSQDHCCKRWSCLLASSLFLPCLCLHPILSCGVAACTACYNCTRRRGCHCRDSSKHLAHKGLLESESSST